MHDIITFLVENWRLILEFVLLIGSVVVACTRKRPFTKIFDASAYSNLITLVQEAEEKFGAGHGYEKLQFVLNKYLKIKNLEDIDDWNKSSLIVMIERILSTPQKKGDK